MPSKQSRRRFFIISASTLTLFSGCSGLQSTSDSTQSTQSPTISNTRSTSKQSPQSSSTPLPVSSYSFDWSAELLRSSTSSDPAKIRLSLTNTASEQVQLGFGPTPPFSMPLPNSTDRRVPVLFHPEMGDNGKIPTTQENGCWRVQSELISIYDLLEQRQLEPDETISNTYVLLAQKGTETAKNGCFADGTYNYIDTVLLGRNEKHEMELPVELAIKDGEFRDISAPSPEIA